MSYPKLSDAKSGFYIIKIIVCAALALLLCYSVVLRIRILAQGVWLWDDEAMLTLNILSKDVGALLTPPLDMHQNSPMLYLVIVKTFAAIFGTSEAVLRLYSLIGFIGFLVCFALLLRRAFHLSWVYICLGLAAISTFVVYIRYSLEVKPYMGDVCFIFLVLLLYRLYKERRVGLPLFTLVCVICLFLSTPSIFFIGGIFIFEFLLNLRKPYSLRLLISLMICGVIILAVFAANYFYWMKPTTDDAYMVDFWNQNRFQIRFWNLDALKHDLIILRYELLEFIPFKNGLTIFWFFLAPAGFVISLIRKNIYTAVIGISILLLLVASNLGFYPISLRLWLFVYAFVFLYSIVFIAALTLRFLPEEVCRQKSARIVIQVILAGVLLAGNYSFVRAGEPASENLGAWDKGMRVQPLAEYVNVNIEEGESVYSYFMASNILRYELRYRAQKLPNLREDMFLFGTIDMSLDANEVVNRDGGAYLLFANSYFPVKRDTMVYDLLSNVEGRGYLDRVEEVNYTPLYWFAKEKSELKTGVEMELLSQTPDGQVTVRVTNTGKTYLETEESLHPFGMMAERRGAVQTVLRLYRQEELVEERLLSPLPYPLAPGAQCELGLQPGEIQNADSARIELVSEGRFDFSELGTVSLWYNSQVWEITK
ncbi:hypothetical protein AGMMS49983_16370 [Clostridia bacterium]|nr:hypothetical protein AGMMS49983_16370 [Clostridia bacterium]